MTGNIQEHKNIYVASSWRNNFQPAVVTALRIAGFEVYDFKNPPDKAGFGWEQINADWKDWTNDEYLYALEHPLAEEGFKADFDAMKWADTFVLVQPCGRSAHLELGWAVGAGKHTCILLSTEPEEPELMVKMCDHISHDIIDLLGWLGVENYI